MDKPASPYASKEANGMGRLADQYAKVELFSMAIVVCRFANLVRSGMDKHVNHYAGEVRFSAEMVVRALKARSGTINLKFVNKLAWAEWYKQ